MKRFAAIILTIGLLPCVLAATAISVSSPPDATYITQTANGVLSNEQALSSLSTGIVKVTTSTGALTSFTDSAGLSGVLSDETGSGLAVFATSPTFTTPILGTPTSGNLTNCTGIRTQTSVSWLAGNLAQNTTYYVGQVIAAPSTTAPLRRIYIPTACTLTKGYGWWTSTNASSNENCTIVIRKNNSSDTTFATAAVGASNTPVTFNNASIGLSLAAGDYIEVKITTAATFGTAPNSVYGGITLEFSY